MFKRNDKQYLIQQIPRFSLCYENLEDLCYFDELIDVRSKDDYFLDHLKRPEVSCTATNMDYGYPNPR